MVQHLSAIALLLIAAAVTAGAPTDEPAATMALVALDARGRAIHNLTPADLELREAGERRKVRSVVHRGAARRIALFLDDYHVSSGAHSERLRTAAERIIERTVRDGDTLFVMQPLDSQLALGPMPTAERARERIAAFTGRKEDLTPSGAFEAEYLSAAPAAVARERAQIVRSALLALVIALREQPEAAKAMVVITEPFGELRSRRRLTTLRMIARAARLANVPVYIVDPSAAGRGDSPPDEGWTALARETGGALFEAGRPTTDVVQRIVADIESQYLVSFETHTPQDGSFRTLEVRSTRKGMSVRAPSGYWAPFAASALVPATPALSYRMLLTPHVSGLIQPWFRMAPGSEGRTRVTFLWAPRPGTTRNPELVDFAAITFEGDRLHQATVSTRTSGRQDGSLETSFEVKPGPLQISMAVSDAAAKLLDTDVRYIDVPKLDAARPVITSVEFIRPRSLPEFTGLRDDPAAVPTSVREFLRQDRLLVRVRAFAGQGLADVQVRLVNLRGGVLLELPDLGVVGGAAQFELPFARFARGEYRLEIRATGPAGTVTQLVPVRLIG